MVKNFSQAEAVELCYKNVIGSCLKTPHSPGPRAILYAVLSFGAVLAVFGNLLVITAILHFRQLHTSTKFLIASLACADFLVGVTVTPFNTVRPLESCWNFGESYHKFHTFNNSFCFASLFHLCCNSIDRYIAVTDPLTYPTKFTDSVSGICIVLSWFFSVTYSFSIFHTGVNEEGVEDLVVAVTCVGGCPASLHQNWVLLCFLLFFIATVAMVFVIYGKVFLVAKYQARKIEGTASQVQSSSESYKERVTKRERKAAKTLGIAMAAFLVSWLPYIIDAIIDTYMNFITPPYAYEILVWCVYCNSAMNPLIAFFYPWFQKAIKLIASVKVLGSDSSIINLFSEEADVY
ncbi:LOW QUALITY PROTEIN: trace amine-associated receptor 9 [Megaptera novaeangliae]